jgi:hypothetical protein
MARDRKVAKKTRIVAFVEPALAQSVRIAAAVSGESLSAFAARAFVAEVSRVSASTLRRFPRADSPSRGQIANT